MPVPPRRCGHTACSIPTTAPTGTARCPGIPSSTRHSDQLTGIGKSQVSRLCQDIDERVGAFLDRPITGEWPYLWLDATYLKQREGGRIVSVAAIIAVAVNSEGKREIVGLHIGPSEAETHWAAFLKSLVRRGLRGVAA